MELSADPAKNHVLAESYWKRQAGELQGDARAESVYEAVGCALTKWEMMEESLAELYLQLVGASKSSSDPVRRAFGSIESNSGRRKAIDAAAEAYLGRYWEEKDVKSAFLALTKAVGSASRRRDDIAHGIVLGQRIDQLYYGYFLFPPDYNTLRTNIYADTGDGDPLAHTMTKYRFTSQQIRSFGFKFAELQETVRNHTGFLNTPDLFVRLVRGVDVFGEKLLGR